MSQHPLRHQPESTRRTCVQRVSPGTPSGDPTLAQEWVEAAWGDGAAHPDTLATKGSPHLVERSFVFVDLCSFTQFCDVRGPEQAMTELERFRGIVRSVAARRGVRIARWLGDGAMLIALTPAPAISTAVEIVGRTATTGDLAARGGMARGAALLFDGDDHIGAAVNLASRLCDQSDPDEVLVTAAEAENRPQWVSVTGSREVNIRGMSEVGSAERLVAGHDVLFLDDGASRQ